MKRMTKSLLEILLGILLMIAALGYAGTTDYTEEVIYHMSQPTFDAIIEKLGDSASLTDIAREYTDNKVYYDTYY